jgi:hypothetical protein
MDAQAAQTLEVLVFPRDLLLPAVGSLYAGLLLFAEAPVQGRR